MLLTVLALLTTAGTNGFALVICDGLIVYLLLSFALFRGTFSTALVLLFNLVLGTLVLRACCGLYYVAAFVKFNFIVHH
jgi:hypothetical protein